MEPITRKEIYLNQIARNTGGSGGEVYSALNWDADGIHLMD